MAASAIEGQSQHALAGHRDQIIQAIEGCQQGIGRFVIPDTQAIVAGCGQAFDSRGVEFVARQLLDEEAMVGLVVIESPNDVIAILPSVRLGTIALETVGFRIANHVQPMTPPTLTEPRVGQQTIDDYFP